MKRRIKSTFRAQTRSPFLALLLPKFFTRIQHDADHGASFSFAAKTKIDPFLNYVMWLDDNNNNNAEPPQSRENRLIFSGIKEHTAVVFEVIL